MLCNLCGAVYFLIVPSTGLHVWGGEYVMLLYVLVDFFGPKWHSLRSLTFQGPKMSRFQGPPLLMALVMDLARIKISTFRAI